MSIVVEHQITVKLDKDKTVVLTKLEAEQLYSALCAALNKPVYYPTNNNNLWFNASPSIGIRDCVAQGAQGAA